MRRSGWHREDIKAAIRKRGVTLSRLALDNDLSESTVRNALGRPLIAGEIAISRFLGIAPEVLWPERYDLQRRAKFALLLSQNKHRQRQRHGQNASGALT